MKAKSDWKENKIIKAFEANSFSLKKEDSKIFEEEEIIRFPFVKYKILYEGNEFYLILIQFENTSDATNNATRISNQFRASGSRYVSSGVNGDILSLVISKNEQKSINSRAFEILKAI